MTPFKVIQGALFSALVRGEIQNSSLRKLAVWCSISWTG